MASPHAFFLARPEGGWNGWGCRELGKLFAACIAIFCFFSEISRETNTDAVEEELLVGLLQPSHFQEDDGGYSTHSSRYTS